MKDELAAAADVILHNVEHSTRGGMKLILKLKDVAELKDFENITRYRNGHAGGIYRMILMGKDWGSTQDVMFLGWSASHTGGVKLRFQLGDEKDLKFLMDVPRGTECSMGMRELDEEGDMVDERVKERVEAERGGPLSKRAAQLGRDYDFRQWLARTEFDVVPSEVQCADYIRNKCGVSSRAMLDHDDRAAERFKTMILNPYIQYLYHNA